IKLYFNDVRNFGNMEITNNIEILNNKLNSLAPDFLKEDFTNNEFHQMIVSYVHVNNKLSQARMNKEIVKVLMDQNSIGSGIGNYLVAEILFKAKISPYTKLKK